MIIFYGLRTGQGSAGWFFCSVSCPWRSLGDTQLVDGLFWGPRRLCSQVWCLGRAGWKGGPPPRMAVSEWSYQLRAPRVSVPEKTQKQEVFLDLALGIPACHSVTFHWPTKSPGLA